MDFQLIGMVSLIFWWLWLPLLRSSIDTCSIPSIKRFNCVTISVASFRLSPSAVYLKNMQHGMDDGVDCTESDSDDAVELIRLYNFNANPPPWITFVPFSSLHRCQSLHRSNVAWFCSLNRSFAKYINFDVPIECCSCENMPVKMINCCTCCSVKNSNNSLKNAINRAPVTNGERNWKQAKRFSAQTNSSHAVVILFAGDFASFDMIWCSNARGPRIGIIADCKDMKKKGKMYRINALCIKKEAVWDSIS